MNANKRSDLRFTVYRFIDVFIGLEIVNEVKGSQIKTKLTHHYKLWSEYYGWDE